MNNYFGRQFSSLNDLVVNPTNGDLYFTDTLYPGMREQVYRYNFDTGALTVVADGFGHPNGITISPDGKKAYVSDTGVVGGFYGLNLTAPASIYSYDVSEDGTFDNRKTFAYVPAFIPDGMFLDADINC